MRTRAKREDSQSADPSRHRIVLQARLGCFFFNDTATTEIYTLSLHDALPTLPRAPVTSTRIDPPCLALGRWYNIPLSAFRPSERRVKALHENRRRRGDGQPRDQWAPVARKRR